MSSLRHDSSNKQRLSTPRRSPPTLSPLKATTLDDPTQLGARDDSQESPVRLSPRSEPSSLFVPGLHRADEPLFDRNSEEAQRTVQGSRSLASTTRRRRTLGSLCTRDATSNNTLTSHFPGRSPFRLPPFVPLSPSSTPPSLPPAHVGPPAPPIRARARPHLRPTALPLSRCSPSPSWQSDSRPGRAEFEPALPDVLCDQLEVSGRERGAGLGGE